MSEIYSVRNLKMSYKTKTGVKEVLKDVSFDIEKGETTVIRGNSGAGKSTLLGLLAGLDKATSGIIKFCGEDLCKMGNSALSELRRRRIGVIFQRHNLIPAWSAFDNIKAALIHKSLSAQETEKKVTAMMESFGLSDHHENTPEELSVGQQQRVAIARTVINEPDIIIADEPTGDVDEETALRVVGVFEELVRNGVTLIVCSHGHFRWNGPVKALELSDGLIFSMGGVGCA